MNGEGRRPRASSGTTATALASHELHRGTSLPTTTDPSDDADTALVQMRRRHGPLCGCRRSPMAAATRCNFTRGTVSVREAPGPAVQLDVELARDVP